uniref:Uncharacterized protein n=1 Tax=Arundo donax TaxID=35708 RepID=A0A0A9HRC0_ARUDO
MFQAMNLRLRATREERNMFQAMNLRLRATQILALLCFWLAVVMAIGSIVTATDVGRRYCESPNPPKWPFPERPGRCPPP